MAKHEGYREEEEAEGEIDDDYEEEEEEDDDGDDEDDPRREEARREKTPEELKLQHLFEAISTSPQVVQEDLIEASLVTLVDEDTGKTALHIAAEANAGDWLEALLKRGSPTEVLDKEGYAPLHRATAMDRAGLVQKLLAANADPNRLCKNSVYTDYTALHFAAFVGSATMTKLLLSHGADVHRQTDAGTTALSIAARGGNRAVTLGLLDAGADPKVADRMGVTPLMLAVTQGRTQIVELLLKRPDHRILVEQVDKTGDGVLHHAFQIQLQRLFGHGFEYHQEQEDIAFLLLKHGAPLFPSKVDSLLPIDYASEPLRAILLAVQSQPELFPDSLEQLLRRPEYYASKGTFEIDLIQECAALVVERDKAKALEESRGGCPVMSGGSKQNRITKRLRGETPTDQQAHPNIAGGDESKCPFLAKQRQEAQAIPPLQASSDSSSYSSAKGKCPIPFHREISSAVQVLKTKGFWLYVGGILVAMYVARKL